MSAADGAIDLGLCGFDSATGFACAEALGLDAYLELGDGFDGRTYALDDPEGRVLKVSRRPNEAALAALLMAEREAGRPLPAFPVVHAVLRLEVEGVGPLWAVVRESVDDPYPDPTPEEEARRRSLDACAEALSLGWRTDDRTLVARALASLPEGAPDLSRVVPALHALRGGHGLTVSDIGRSAFGTTRDGRFVVRDFGKVSADPGVIGPLLDGLPPPVAVPSGPRPPSP
jgi:hypothetical protein